jgi:hypothetical protein
VPNAGVVPLSGNRDVVGQIVRNVRDAALCLDGTLPYRRPCETPKATSLPASSLKVRPEWVVCLPLPRVANLVSTLKTCSDSVAPWQRWDTNRPVANARSWPVCDDCDRPSPTHKSRSTRALLCPLTNEYPTTSRGPSDGVAAR